MSELKVGASTLVDHHDGFVIRGAMVLGGARLNPGDFVLSPIGVTDAGIDQKREASSPTRGRYMLAMQTDGNLVLYDEGSGDRHRALWASGTSGHPGAYATMQLDGNLVVYEGGRALWASGTSGHPGAALAVQSDDNLVVYALPSGVLWARRDHGGGFWSGVLDVVQTIAHVGEVAFPISPFTLIDVVANGPGDALSDGLVSVKAAGQFMTGDVEGAAATMAGGLVGAATGGPQPEPPPPPPPPPPPLVRPSRWETPAEWARRELRGGAITTGV